MKFFNQTGGLTTPQMKRDYLNFYSNPLRSSDRYLARLLDRLTSTGLLDDTLVIHSYDIKHRRPPQWEMYDLRTDPLEVNNLASEGHKMTPEQEREFHRLKVKLARVQETRLKPPNYIDIILGGQAAAARGLPASRSRRPGATARSSTPAGPGTTPPKARATPRPGPGNYSPFGTRSRTR